MDSREGAWFGASVVDADQDTMLAGCTAGIGASCDLDRGWTTPTVSCAYGPRSASDSGRQRGGDVKIRRRGNYWASRCCLLRRARGRTRVALASSKQHSSAEEAHTPP